MSTLICPHCGSSITVDANFCPHCGTLLRDVDPDLHQRTVEEASTLHAEAEAQRLANVRQRQDGGESPKNSEESPESDPLLDSLAELTAQPGLLDPVPLTDEWSKASDARPPIPVNPFSDAQLRRIRQRVQQEPPLVQLAATTVVRERSFRVRWLFWLLLLVLLAGMILQPRFLSPPPPTLASARTGIGSAYRIIETLPPQPRILIYWAYDPSSAGEMDTVSAPLVRHLVRRQAKSYVLTTLPGGLITAERVFRSATGANEVEEARTTILLDNAMPEREFLAGGALALPLIGASICHVADDRCQPAAINPYAVRIPGCLAGEHRCQFDLALIVADRAEEVQQWLERVAPHSSIPVIAVTSALAELPLRPYLQSEQLQGLISGFDSSARYTQLLNDQLSRQELAREQRHRIGQSWGHLVLLGLLLLANFVALGTERAEE